MVTLVIVVLSLLIASTIKLLCNHVRLNTTPGPVLAGLSDFWRLRVENSPEFGHCLRQLHEKYGTIVRIGPDLVSVSDPTAIVPIYTRRSRNRRNRELQFPATCHGYPTAPVCDRRFDAQQYEGLIDPAVRNLVNTFRRYHTLDLTSFLHFFATDFLSRLTTAGPVEPNDARLPESTDRCPRSLPAWLALPGAEYLLFKGPLSRMKRQRGYPVVCEGFRSRRFSSKYTAVSCHTSSKSEDHPSPMQEHLDCIMKVFTSTFLFLLKYPAVMRQLRSEIATARNRNILSPFPLWSELSHLKYLQAVMKESMRLSCMQCVRDVITPPGGVTVSGHYIPQGTTIRRHPQVVHNNAHIYGGFPHIFDPERWLNGDIQQQSHMTQCLVLFQQQAFDHPRLCAAWWELKKAIVVVLMKFDLDLCTAPEAVRDTDIGLDLPPVLVRFMPRS